MTVKYFVAAMAVLAGGIAGCDRTTPNVSIDLQKLPAQAELQIEKAGSTLDDAAVTSMVKTALIAEPGVKGLAIDVDTRQNVVTLSGVVASDELREEAEPISRKVQGVKDVKNNLTVKRTS